MSKLLLGVILFGFLTSAVFAQPHRIISGTGKSKSIVQEVAGVDSALYLVKVKAGRTIDEIAGLIILRRLDQAHYVVRTMAVLPTDIVDLQAPANNLWKASDNLLAAIQNGGKRPLKVRLSLTRELTFPDAKEIKIKGNLVSLTVNADQLRNLLNNPAIQFADLQRKATEETLINNLDLAVNQINRVHAAYPLLNGSGIHVSLKEQLFNFNDLDLLGRAISSPDQSPSLSAHATVMATLVGGSGNSFIKGRGAAPGVSLSSSDYTNLSPDPIVRLNALGIGIQNHSYGTGIENYYGIEAAEYDQQIYLADTIIHVFSSGNSGTATPATGLYAGIPNYANLTGTFKQAKNVLVVGGTNNENTLEALSSAGPAYDGRIKPELVTAGEEGTSGAAALTSGVVALLQQQYQAGTGHLPSSALIKSVLLNSAVDLGTPNPDYKSGFGRLNAYEALQTISEKRFLSGSVADKEEQVFPLPVLQDGEIKLTIAWNDAPARLNSPSALINDLDLWLEDPAGNRIMPWTLSSHPHPDSLSKPATRQKDSLNNVEQVSLNGRAGNYMIHVRGARVSGNQQYYISHQAKAEGQFHWTYPLSDAQLFAGEDNYLRWDSTLPLADGIVSVSFDEGLNWQEIARPPMQAGLVKWNTPDIFSRAILKMSVEGKDFISEAFSVSKPMTLNVGYNCTDGVLLMWSKTSSASAYNVYSIKDNSLQLLKTTSDTSVLIGKPQEVSSDYYAVSSVHQSGFEGLRSLTINAADQGVGCYFQSLLADVTPDKTIGLSLGLGTATGLKSIRWEKQTGPDSFSTLGNTLVIPGNTAYNFSDVNPKQGVQYYRAVLQTLDNRQIISDLASVIFLDAYNFTLYPNPASQDFTILSGTIDNFELTIFNAQGKKLRTDIVNNISQTINVETLNKGIYVYIISLKGKPVFRGKLIKI